jgi:hypothetical protein
MNNVCDDDDEEYDGVGDGMMWFEVGCRSLETSTAHAKLWSRVLARGELFFKKRNEIIVSLECEWLIASYINA